MILQTKNLSACRTEPAMPNKVSCYLARTAASAPDRVDSGEAGRREQTIGSSSIEAPVGASAHLQEIQERDLLIYIRSRVLERLTIVQTTELTYQLRVRLSLQDSELVLINVRGGIREWVSLDRLARHIRSKYGDVSGLSLSLLPH